MAAPTTANVLTRLRGLLRDPADAIVPEFSTLELLGYIEDAVRDAQTVLKAIDQNYGIAEVDFDLSEGQQVYTPDDMVTEDDPPIKAPIVLYRMDLGTRPDEVPLIQGGFDEFKRWELSLRFSMSRGLMKGMWAGDDLWICPTPTVTIADALRLRYEMELVPDAGYVEEDGSDSILLPRAWLVFVRYRAAASAKHQDEKNPGPLWNRSVAEEKRLRADYNNRRSGQAPETVRTVTDERSLDYYG